MSGRREKEPGHHYAGSKRGVGLRPCAYLRNTLKEGGKEPERDIFPTPASTTHSSPTNRASHVYSRRPLGSARLLRTFVPGLLLSCRPFRPVSAVSGDRRGALTRGAPIPLHPHGVLGQRSITSCSPSLRSFRLIRRLYIGKETVARSQFTSSETISPGPSLVFFSQLTGLRPSPATRPLFFFIAKARPFFHALPARRLDRISSSRRRCNAICGAQTRTPRPSKRQTESQSSRASYSSACHPTLLVPASDGNTIEDWAPT